VPSYGENFRRLRGEISQEEIARRLKLKRQANVSAIELSQRIPTPRMILKHAAALRQPPSELLKDVITEYDRIRSGAYDGLAPPAMKVKAMGEAPAPAGRRRRR
jgi:transcriptional regulator with XRE-family HTH domain